MSKNLSVCLSVCDKLWPQLCYFTKDYLIFHLTRTKNHLKKVCTFGCQSCFCKPVFASKNPDLHHSQGVWNLPHKFHLYLIIINFLKQIGLFRCRSLCWGDILLNHLLWSIFLILHITQFTIENMSPVSQYFILK